MKPRALAVLAKLHFAAPYNIGMGIDEIGRHKVHLFFSPLFKSHWGGRRCYERTSAAHHLPEILFSIASVAFRQTLHQINIEGCARN